MKKFFFPLLTLACALAALVAVSGGAARTEGGAVAAKPAAAEQTYRVALVTDTAGLNDRSFNFLANQGRLRANARLGVQSRVFISRTQQDYVPNLRSAAQQGYNLVIAVGFLLADPINTVASAFPNTKFAIIDYDATTLKDKPRNVRGLLFKEQEAGYLAGYLSALHIKRLRGVQKMSTVGGIKIPPVDRYIAGFQAGAKKANPALRRAGALMNGYSQDFQDQAKCKEIALNQIAQGSRVVFQVAGLCGLGALDAARQRGRFGIGVDADQGYLGRHILTSALKRVDVAVFNTIRLGEAQGANLRGGFNALFSVANGGIGLGKISPRVNRADIVATNRVRALIARQRVAIPDKLS